ncbi:MAG: hypothetical protein SP1CHLAM54_15770 [Chlamydiia bacterium]|nr:hypothetical protein [Chlamydiia bacterium]MCH9616466.1 hypothetical protein [Chlamydiia bacterium]MCH9629548.1 hypothetical protein [Chlamydiia bacterium]
MTDQDFRGKSAIKGIGGSLAVRILLVTLIFLVFPLLFLSVMMYMHDFDTKKRDNFFALNLIADEKMQEINHVVYDAGNILNITHDIILSQNPKGDYRNSLTEINLAFKRIAERNGLIEMFYSHLWPNGQFVCETSSNSASLGKNTTKLFSKLQLTKKDNFFFYQEAPDRKSYEFYIAKPIYSNHTGKLKGVLTLIFSASYLAELLESTGRFSFPISSSILNKDGKVMASTRPDFFGLSVIQQTSEKKPPTVKGKHPIVLVPDTGNFKFEFDKEASIAVILDLEEQNIFLFIETSANINFINIQRYFLLISAFIFSILIIGGGGTLWFTFRISKPLRQLCYVMEDVAEGNLSARFIPDKMGFEINIVGERFNRMVNSLLHNMSQVKNEKVAREMLAKELKIGQEIQTSLLPVELPEFEGVEISSGFMSAKEVGGDFFDYIVREKTGELMFTVADTSGKGVFACLYSLVLRSLLRSFGKSEQNLALAVKETNNLFCSDTRDSGVFVTLWTAFFHPETGKLTYTSAGHFPAILKKASGELIELTTSGIALGVIHLDEVETGEITLEKGDTLILFTDGVVEAHDAKLNLFGMDRLKTLLENDHSPKGADIVQKILDEVKAFAENTHQHDDITILTLKI